MVAEKQENVVIFRSRLTTMAAAVDGFCTGMVATANSGQTVSHVSVSLFSALVEQVRSLTKGAGLEAWPMIEEGATVGDLLVASMTLRSLYLSFFTPEQIEEYRQVSAFNMAEYDRQRRAGERREDNQTRSGN